LGEQWVHVCVGGGGQWVWIGVYVWMGVSNGCECVGGGGLWVHLCVGGGEQNKS